MGLEKERRLGPYTIVAPLGAGGRGEVYRALDRRLERHVALKVLPPQLSREPQALAWFEREAKVLAALSHPHILTIFDVGTEHDVSFVVTELLEGETLRTRIARQPIAWRESVGIARDIARGLAAAHSRGVVHRDLKPENVFIATGGLVKILDFGLARMEQPPEASDPSATILSDPELAGTVPYLSPEQLRGKMADARSDIFSFGCTLFEMVTGSQPFSGATQAETIAAILRDPTPSIRAAAPDAPESLDALVRACLEKAPDARLQSAADVLTALGAVSSDAGATAPSHGRATHGIASIAVLPFEDASGSADTEYLCDGLTDRIIDALSQLPGLRVMARSTVFRYKGRGVTPHSIGRDLGVQTILTGRVTNRGDVVSMQIELVDTNDGARLWGAEHTAETHDLLGLLERVAVQVPAQLRLKLLPREEERMRRRPTESENAFRLYLQGRFYLSKRTQSGLLRALELFEQALQEDALFPLAHSGLAEAYALLGGFLYLPASEAYSKARIEVTRALELDPNLAEAHATLAMVKYRYEWDWSGCEREFRLALQTNPSYAMAHSWYAVFLVLMQRFEAGLASMDAALALDPMSVVQQWTRGYILYYTRDFDAALQQHRQALAMDPTFARVHVDAGIIHALRGDYRLAIEEVQKAASLLEDNPGLLASLGYVYALAGDRDEAHRILADLAARSKRRPVSPFTVALIHVGLGDVDAAFEWLGRSLEQREDALVSLKVNPRIDPLRGDPRLDALMRRVGLPE
jgi:serine/threonine-protein kinase